ncbi:alkaline ceramidase 3-like [Oppia nitens]|uniref:alkaline ceramidase 3-like n=1 Tax=Oppia nitens TaxID=1686743 RepID=UPI0023DAC0F6|nr:alkaline ceramidase 3-like [Oppia nitens]
MAPSIGLSEPGVYGMWGVVTSTLDWCETNYETTRYVAEFWNTVSNVVMIWPPIIAIYHAFINDLERRYMLCFGFLCLVGCGSWMFHMTLKYEMQLFDELPMLWGSLMLVYCMLTLLYPIDCSWKQLLATKVGLISYGIISTLLYLCFKTPILFQVSYGFMVTLMLYWDICLVKYKPCDKRIFIWAAIFYYTGFALWNIDNIFCDKLGLFRQILPSFLVPFTQLHALWHCLAGYGSYLHIVFTAHSRALIRDQKVKLIWCWYGVVLSNEKHFISYKKVV